MTRAQGGVVVGKGDLAASSQGVIASTIMPADSGDATLAALPNPVDFTADGRGDIFWRNVVTGDNYI